MFAEDDLIAISHHLRLTASTAARVSRLRVSNMLYSSRTDDVRHTYSIQPGLAKRLKLTVQRTEVRWIRVTWRPSRCTLHDAVSQLVVQSSHPTSKNSSNYTLENIAADKLEFGTLYGKFLLVTGLASSTSRAQQHGTAQRDHHCDCAISCSSTVFTAAAVALTRTWW